MTAAQLGAARADLPRLFEPSIQESPMTLVRSIFLAIGLVFVAGTVAQAADPAPAAEAAPAGEKKEKKAKKSKKTEEKTEKTTEEKK
jgi:hypothetical protein